MDPEPLVSIILPTYNRAAYLRQAIQSVLDQTYRHWELWVVDDGSTDDTREVLAGVTDERIQIVRCPHSGNRARVRNRGIAQAQGAYVAFLDDDDLWMPQKLAVQLADLRVHPDCRWSYTYFKPINERGEDVPLPRRAEWQPVRGWIFRDLVAGRAWVGTPTVLAERSLLLEAGRFDESFLYSEDYELWLRVSLLSAVTLVTDLLVAVRWQPGRVREASVFRHGVEMYRRLLAAGQLGDARSVCHRQWILASVNLANRLRFEGAYREALSTLGTVLPYGLVRPRWWVSLAKTGLRPLVPGPLLRAYHDWRAMLDRRGAA